MLPMFDPFRDGRYGILIGVNALGVQLDEIHISNAEPDNSWDILFDSATALQNDGYSAEFIIPFAELQLPDEEVQNGRWGLSGNLIRQEFKLYLDLLKIFQRKLAMHVRQMRSAFRFTKKIYRSYLYPIFFLIRMVTGRKKTLNCRI